MAYIEVTNLQKDFEGKKVLTGVDLTINKGESVVILGASGCGKSVFIKILSSLINASKGSIKIEGQEILTLNEEEQEEYIKKISFLFQLNALFDSMPIWKNICLAKIENEKLSKKEAMQIAKQKLAEVNLKEEILNLHPNNISGGMQKRVALARCLTSNPELIFFDEPTTGLDPETSIIIGKLLRNVQNKEQNLTKISIMHDIEVAKIVADRFIFFYEGKVEWQGTPKELELSNNKNLKVFLGTSSK